MDDSADDADADSYLLNMRFLNKIHIGHDLLFYQRAGCAFLRQILRTDRVESYVKEIKKWEN